MSRGPRTRLWSALWLALLAAACERGASEVPPQARSGVSSSQAVQALGAADCRDTVPSTLVDGWKVAPVQSAGGPVAHASFPAVPAERALVVVQETSGVAGASFTAKTKLNGLASASLDVSSRLAAKVVDLSAFNLLELEVQGSGAARASVAALSQAPCTVLASKATSRGGRLPTTVVIPYTWPAGSGQGVLVVESGGSRLSGKVWVDDQQVAALSGTQPQRVVIVAPKSSGTLRLEAGGDSGNWVQVMLMDPDMLPPTVNMQLPSEGELLGFSPVFVQGQAAAGAISVKVGTQEAFLSQETYTARVPVQEGPNALLAEARDTCGNVARVCRGVELVSQPPRIVIQGVSDGQLTKEQVVPTWYVESSGPSSVVATLDLAPFVSGTPVSTDGSHELRVVASDEAGRQGQARVGFVIDMTPPVITLKGVEEGTRRNKPVVLSFSVVDAHPGSMEATLDGAPMASGATVRTEGPHELVVLATDAAGNHSEARRHFVLDLTGPTLEVLSPGPGLYTQAATVEVEASAGDDGPLASVLLGGAELVRGEDGHYRGTVTLEEGSNLLVLLARDVAGNTTQRTLQLTRDTTPPRLTLTTPSEDMKVSGGSVQVEGQVEDATPLTVKVAGLSAAIEADGHFQLTVSVAQGPGSVEAVVIDAAGNTTRLRRAFRVNSTPPRLDLIAPAAGTSTGQPSIQVSGFARAADHTDGVKLEVAGGEHSVGSDGRFSVDAPLALGVNTVSITAVDGYGLRTTRTVRVVRTGAGDGGTEQGPGDAGSGPPDGGSPDAGAPDAGAPDAGPTETPPPVLVLSSPQEDSLWATERVAVLGRVEGGTLPLEVTVEGLPVSVTGHQFSASLALPEGSFLLSVRAVDSQGRVAQAQRQVRVDRTPPYLDVTRPDEPLSTVTESPYLVEGQVGDAYLGGVTVNGVPAQVLAGHFSSAVRLVAGDNAVVVEAADLAGNRARVTRTLRVQSMPPQLSVLEPVEGSEARQPVVRVSVQVEASAPLAEVRIGTGLAAESSAGVYTAQVPLALGENTLTLMARDTLGFTGTATLHVRYRDPGTEPLAVTGVDPADQDQGREPDTLVNVSFNKPVTVASAHAGFTVSVNGQLLPGGFSVAPGGQTVSFIARDPLPESAILQVRVAGVEPVQGPGMEGEFRSTFTVRRPLTRLRGTVLDERREPLAGVRVEVEGQSLSATTGTDGNWAIFDVAAGPVVLRYEGPASSGGDGYPTVRRPFAVGAEQDNEDSLLMLTPVDAASAETVDTSLPVHLTFGGRHGALALDIPAGGMLFADGTVRGTVTATELPPTSTSPVRSDGALVPAVMWQLQPAGTRLMAPVELRLPNRTNAPAGHKAAIFTYEPETHLLRVTAMATVSADGSQWETDAPLEANSLEFFGYLPLPEETTGALEGFLASSRSQANPLPRSASDGFVRPLHTGFGLDPSSALWLYDNLFNLLGPMGVTGVVRGPREQGVAITLGEPTLNTVRKVSLTSEKRFVLPLSFSARTLFESPPTDSKPEPLTATIKGTGPSGQPLGPPSGNGQWLKESPGGRNVSLSSAVELSPGTSLLTFSGISPRGRDTLSLSAELAPSLDGPPDAGVDWRLSVHRVTADGGTGAWDAGTWDGLVRFRDIPVITESAFSTGGAYTNAKGQYGTIVLGARSFFLPDTLVWSSVHMPVGTQVSSWVEGSGSSAVVKTRTVPAFVWEFSPAAEGRSAATLPDGEIVGGQLLTGLDITIDARWLHGSLTFVDREGKPLKPSCDTQREPDGGVVLGVSEDDIRSTEVHFFSETDLSQPIAGYAVADPEPCDSQQEGKPQGKYARMRLGPSAVRILGPNYKGRNPQRLGPGDRLVVFAINHATGYAGMTTVTVPSVMQSTRGEDGTCSEDEIEGPLVVTEQGRTVQMSHCTAQELGIGADIKLYPPELDVRVERRARAEGVNESMEPSLVRHGGAATTRDEFVKVSTQWRVRREPASPWQPQELKPVAPGCDGGIREADGGFCEPQTLLDEGRQARLLERYCAEFTPPLTKEQQAECLKDDSKLADVPAGVPPLAGRVVLITGSAAEQPGVAQFRVKPGRGSATVQTAMRVKDSSGASVTLNNLPRANYYVQVVGHAVLPRDRNRDGTVDSSEENAPPPDFTDGADLPGLPNHAVHLKNVYRSLETDGGPKVERFDLAREHEFRVLEVGKAEVTARTDRGESRPLPKPGDPPSSAAASSADVAYQFLLNLLEPQDKGRAGTLSGQYVLRLGSDSFGIDCPIQLDEETHKLSGSCEGEYLPEVLSASDIVYLEVYLRGNAENVLYRFNFDGLSRREDYVAAASEFTAESAVARKDGKPTLERPVSQPNEVHFFLSPQEFPGGRIRLCTTEDCSGSGSLIKESFLQSSGSMQYTVSEVEGGQATARLVQEPPQGAAGTAHFRQALPSTLALMPGAQSRTQPSLVFLVKDPEMPVRGHSAERLGQPKGNFQGLHAGAEGQVSVMGVNLAALSVSFRHTDFEVPQLAEIMDFSRIYDNQSDLISPTGVGWSHSFDGFVVEEELGRYVAVLKGQAWSFPRCAQTDRAAQTASGCETDKSHGMELKVDAQGVRLKSEYGPEYWFEQPAVKRDTEGHRKWLLTKLHDGHGRSEDAGWTRLTYAPRSNRLIRVARTPGVLEMTLEYEAIPDNAAGALKALARQEDFQFLKSVTLKNQAKVLHTIAFRHDKLGNLLEADRTTDTPRRKWQYTYKEPPAALDSSKAWRAVNELSAASLLVAGVPERSIRYEREGADCYKHLEPFECVTRAIDQGGDSIRITGSTSQRSIILPGSSMASAKLNSYGNVTNLQASGQRASTLAWASSERGKPVRLNSIVTADQLALTFSYDDRLRLKSISRGATALVAGENLFTVTERLNGLPTAGTLSSGGSPVPWQTPRTAAGDVTSMAVGARSLGSWSFDPEGRILQAVAPTGSTWQTTGFTHPLGLATGVRVTGPAQPSGPQASYEISTSYDPYGRTALISNSQTGLRQKWDYDGVGRVTTYQRSASGTPMPGGTQTWSVEYRRQGAQTSVVQHMAESNLERTEVFQAGKLQSSTVMRGGQPATRSYSYEDGRLSKIIGEQGSVRSFTYDTAGKLLRVEVDGQLETAYQRDLAGRAVVITDRDGRSINLEYDGFGRPVSVTHSDGQQELIQRDSQGNVMRRQLSAPGSETHVYNYVRDELGQLLSVKSEGSGASDVDNHTEYDDTGRPVTIRDEVTGLVESFEYKDILGRMTRHTRAIPSGERVLTWDERRTYTDLPGWSELLIHRTIDTAGEPRQEEQQLRLDANGRVLRSEVPGEGAYEYTYDAQGNLLTVSHTVLGQLASYVYDETGAQVASTGADGVTVSYQRDASGRVLHQYGPHPDEQWAFAYDSTGRLTQRSLAAAGNTPASVWKFFYGGEGRVDEVDPLGFVSERTLDSRGLVLSQVKMASAQPLSPRQCEFFSYDGTQVKSHVVLMDSCDPEQATWESRLERTYDTRGRVRSEQEQWLQAHQLQYTYKTSTSWSGRSAQVRKSWEPTGAPARQVSATVELDGLGNPVSRTQGGVKDEWLFDAAGLLVRELAAGHPERLLAYEQGRLIQELSGTEATSHAYDGAGRSLSETDPAGRVRSWEYDASGRVTREQFGLSGQTLTSLYTYDDAGFLKTMQKGEGPAAALWTFGHGPRGELQSVTLPGGLGSFQYEYDAALQLLAIQPPQGAAVPAQTFAYDFLGRQTRRTRGSSVWTTAWAGGVATQVDPNQDVVETLLDGRDRPARRTYRPGPASQAQSDLMRVDAAYNGNDQLVAVTETRRSGSVANVYEYDARSRLISLQRSNDAVSYGYTDSGQLQSITSPAGSVQYEYDALGRVQQVSSSQGPSMTMTWAPGGLLSEVSGNGVAEQYTYSGHGLISSISAAWGEGSGNRMRREYDYDARGNRLEERYLAPGATAPVMTQYGYDAANRLTGVRYPSGEAALYSVGPDGSRLREKWVQGYQGSLGPDGMALASNPSVYRGYAYDPAGGLLRLDDLLAQPPQAEANFTTDPAGRLLLEQRNSVTRQYQWNGAGQLASLSVTGTDAPDTFSYTYGFDGLRRTRTDGAGTQSRYVWGEGELLEEGLSSGPMVRYAGIGPFNAAAGAQRLLHDGVGSIVARVAASPELMSFGAWGELREGVAPGAGQPSMAFAGLSLEPGSGLYYAQQRWYDPGTGRFLSEDPLMADLSGPLVRSEGSLAQPEGLNPYTYAGGNPVNAADRTGLYEEPIHGALTYYLALMLGFGEGDAAKIALGNASVDHDPETKPVENALKLRFDVVNEWHFHRSPWVALDELTKDKAFSKFQYGRRLHTLMDMGWPDDPSARGPHSNGVHLVFGGLIPIWGLGHPWHTNEDGTFGNLINKCADQPFHNPTMNLNILMKFFDKLQEDATSKFGLPAPGLDRAQVEEFIKKVVSLSTKGEVNDFLDGKMKLPGVKDGYTSYKKIVEANTKENDSNPNEVGKVYWKEDEIDNSIGDETLKEFMKCLPNRNWTPGEF